MKEKAVKNGQGRFTTKAGEAPGKVIWINPVGGLGDTLMLSGILKQVADKNPDQKFMLVRRPGYMSILEGHPAIAGTGFPRHGAEVLGTDYWAKEPLGEPSQRPMQILGHMFGLDGVIREDLYFAGKTSSDPLLDWIPWSSTNIVIAPGSSSPRKEWGHNKWEELARRLRQAGCFVILIGSAKQRYVRYTYSLLGLTTPGQVFPILGRADLIITVDCFIMHASHYTKKQAVVLWGPTRPRIYGYPGQIHLYDEDSCPKPDGCISFGRGNPYTSPCPRSSEHCVDRIRVEEVYDAVERALSKNSSGTGLTRNKNSLSPCY